MGQSLIVTASINEGVEFELESKNKGNSESNEVKRIPDS